jgi:hypothetical protein
VFFFFKQKTVYEILDSELSPEVCSADRVGNYTVTTADGTLTVNPKAEMGTRRGGK